MQSACADTEAGTSIGASKFFVIYFISCIEPIEWKSWSIIGVHYHNKYFPSQPLYFHTLAPGVMSNISSTRLNLFQTWYMWVFGVKSVPYIYCSIHKHYCWKCLNYRQRWHDYSPIHQDTKTCYELSGYKNKFDTNLVQITINVKSTRTNKTDK